MLLSLLKSILPSINPATAKVYLAQHNGIDHPMDVYLAGRFDEWQSWQARRNFDCDHVIGLVEMPETKKWLFTGYTTRCGSSGQCPLSEVLNTSKTTESFLSFQS